jgi:hypothetical protein
VVTGRASAEAAWPSPLASIQQHPEGGQARACVGDDVVDLDEHADPALRQPGQQPYLPHWPGPVQAAPPQLLGDAQQRGLVTGVRERQDLYVIGEVEGRGVHPHRPTQSWPGHVQQLPEPGHQVQPGGDHLPDRLDPQPAARTRQAAVQDG